MKISKINKYPKKSFIVACSQCLLGINCRYDGNNSGYNLLMDLNKQGYLVIIPFCPEIIGGLETPRVPSEIIFYNKKNILESIVKNKENVDVSSYFIKGALETKKLLSLYKIDLVVVKSKSPSCGYKKIYDGTFSKRLIDGNGITTELLLKEGYKIISSDELFQEVGIYQNLDFNNPQKIDDFIEDKSSMYQSCFSNNKEFCNDASFIVE